MDEFKQKIVFYKGLLETFSANNPDKKKDDVKLISKNAENYLKNCEKYVEKHGIGYLDQIAAMFINDVYKVIAQDSTDSQAEPCQANTVENSPDFQGDAEPIDLMEPLEESSPPEISTYDDLFSENQTARY